MELVQNGSVVYVSFNLILDISRGKTNFSSYLHSCASRFGGRQECLPRVESSFSHGNQIKADGALELQEDRDEDRVNWNPARFMSLPEESLCLLPAPNVHPSLPWIMQSNNFLLINQLSGKILSIIFFFIDIIRK